MQYYSARPRVEVTTAEATPAVSLADAKLWLRVDSGNTDDDDVITDMISAATDSAKEYLRRSLINRTLKATFDEFPKRPTDRAGWWDGVRQGSITEIHSDSDLIILPFPPLVSVTSVTTYDTANSGSVFSSSNYTADTSGGRIYLDYGQTWPTDLRDYAAIEVVYVSGYGSAASDIPPAITTAIRMHVMEMYEQRTFCDIPTNCKKMLDPYRIIGDRI